jgi:molybdate transport system substrate-binding protein
MQRTDWLKRGSATAAVLGAAAALAACGSNNDNSGTTASGSVSTGTSTTASSSSGGGARPTVLAAASLTKVFPQIEPNARYTFGGSGALETQIEQGAPADVFAAASPRQTTELFQRGMVTRPQAFATNTLVLVVPRDNPAHITSVNDVTRPGVRLVICNATVPCGDYARNVFTNLDITDAAMKNVKSQTTDVTQTVAQVATGQADAGFVYVTDAKAAGNRVRAIRLPARARPEATDTIAIVRSGKNQAAAEAFVNRILSSSGQQQLRAAGFGKAP